MSHSYSSEYPTGVEIDAGIKQFFEEFYKLSDNPEAIESYADSFTKDATVIMGIKKVVGYDDILAFRKGMWTAVAGRKHTPIKIYPFGSGSEEVMLFGTVEYTFKDGREVTVEWAGRTKLVKDVGKWKIAFYQVYMDSAALAK